MGQALWTGVRLPSSPPKAIADRDDPLFVAKKIITSEH